MFIIFIGFTGCSSKVNRSQEEQDQMGQEPRVEEKEPVIENRIEAPEAYKEEPRHPEAEKTTVVPANTDISHTVIKGESLWRIAAKASVYDNPVLWPKIWLANRNQISNPDMISPGQQLSIPPSGRLKKEEKRASRKHVGK
jgi:nucleoid-associated protein YgaU